LNVEHGAINVEPGEFNVFPAGSTLNPVGYDGNTARSTLNPARSNFIWMSSTFIPADPSVLRPNNISSGFVQILTRRDQKFGQNHAAGSISPEYSTKSMAKSEKTDLHSHPAFKTPG